MQIDKHPPQGSYLKKVLADGTKSFSYRARTHLLLGIPGDDGSRVVSIPKLPPVGFKYTDITLTGDSCCERKSLSRDLHPILNNKRNSTFEQPQDNQITFQHDWSGKENRARYQESSRENQLDSTGRYHKKILTAPHDKERDSVEETKERRASNATTEGSGIDLKKIDQMIPGVSEKKKQFPALLLLSRTEEQNQAKKNKLKVTTENLCSIPRSDIQDRNTVRLATTVHSLDQEKRILDDGHVKTTDTRCLIKDCGRRIELKTESVEKQEHRSTPEDVKILSDDRPSGFVAQQVYSNPQKNKETISVSATHIENESMVGKDVAKKSEINEFNNIEKLRHLTQDITYKRSSQQSRKAFKKAKETIPVASAFKESKSIVSENKQAQSSENQAVVVVKRPNSIYHTPCAFWERSHLHHFHLRILR